MAACMSTHLYRTCSASVLHSPNQGLRDYVSNNLGMQKPKWWPTNWQSAYHVVLFKVVNVCFMTDSTFHQNDITNVQRFLAARHAMHNRS